MGIEVSVAPTAEPVTLAEAKAHMVVTSGDDDAYIYALITAAREMAETYTGRAIPTQTLRLTLDCFPAGAIYLPRAPVQSLTSIAYTDEDGNGQTFSNTQTDFSGTVLHRVEPAVDYSWPSTQSEKIGAVVVTYVAGYGTATDSPNPIPLAIRQAILVKVAELYEHREESIVAATSAATNTFKSLLAPYRLLKA